MIGIMAEPILVAQSKEPIFLLPKMANRHGLIAGATGTGKTVTLQTLAENFSARGVAVFMADVKGDLAGLSQPGANNPKVVERAKELKIDNFTGEACPVVFWDVFGEQGHPVRATVSEMGPLLLGRLLDLNDTQAGVLNMVFKIADDNGLLLLDLKICARCCSTSPTTPTNLKLSMETSRCQRRSDPAQPARAGIAGSRQIFR
jgi:hypothetical protein